MTCSAISGALHIKPDLNTKAVLIVIANCLVYFFVMDITLIPDAHASPGSVVDVKPVVGSFVVGRTPQG